MAPDINILKKHKKMMHIRPYFFKLIFYFLHVSPMQLVLQFQLLAYIFFNLENTSIEAGDQ